jgi:hypothetical protein
VEPTAENIEEMTSMMDYVLKRLEEFGPDYSSAFHSLNDALYKTKQTYKDKKWEQQRKAKNSAKQTSMTSFVFHK